MQSKALGERNTPSKEELVRQVCDYIRQSSNTKLTLRDLGRAFGMSQYQLQRTFVEIMGMSPRRYLEEYRVNILKGRLSRGDAVTHALWSTGYASQSWLYEDSRDKLGMTPATYRKGGSGAVIGYAIGESPIGRMLVAATEFGICSVKVGSSDRELIASLEKEFPKARVVQRPEARHLLAAIHDHLNGQAARLPLDIRGTDFQLRVWAALQQIPIGETRSYGQIAEAIGSSRAVRAVGNACASNPVPLIVPCHRAISSDGSLGGYALGLSRKRKLLEMEREKSKSR